MYVFSTNELDWSGVEIGIRIEVSHDVNYEIILAEFKKNGAGVEFSDEVAEIVSVVNTNELDCSFVEVGIKFDILHDVDDEIILVELY